MEGDWTTNRTAPKQAACSILNRALCSAVPARGQTLAMVPALAKLLGEGIARREGQLDMLLGGAA